MDSNKITIPNIFINSSGPRTLVFEMDNPPFNMASQQGQIDMLKFALASIYPLVRSDINFHSAYLSIQCADNYVGSPVGETDTIFFKENVSNPFIHNEKDGRHCKEIDLPEFSLQSLTEQWIEAIEKSPSSCESGEFSGWSSLNLNSFSFHLPNAFDQMVIDYGPGLTYYPLNALKTENGRIVGGPSAPDIPSPIDLYLKNYGYKITIIVHLIWSYFFDPTQKGTDIIHSWSDSLIEKGWLIQGV